MILGWDGEGWLDGVVRQLRSVGDALWDEVRVTGVVSLLAPVPPFNASPILSPAVAVGGLIAVVLLSGLAVTATGALLGALLLLYLVLERVFGLSFQMDPFGMLHPFGMR